MDFLDKLNANQRIAVETIDGPVMVIAGPGTGKTQILASRIAQILNKTDSQAQNILCLTYTDAGVIAMRKRLIQLIGHEAHRVSIHTFHSFCNRVIQENPEYFDYKSLEPVSDLERIEILDQIATNLPEDHVLKRKKGDVAHIVRNLGDLFNWMKQENITPEVVDTQGQALIEEIRTDPEYQYKRDSKYGKKGELKPAFELDKVKIEKTIAASALFNQYVSLLASRNRYDYQDMILWVINLFQNQTEVLLTYQELFHYFLVDEFQDTSGSQNQILQLLTNYWDKPNVFVVGDDDQSIYRFQGAEVQNVLDFAENHVNHLKSVVLQTNYRSTQAILNTSKLLIEQNESRLVNLLDGELSKDLKAHRDPDNSGQPIQLVELETDIHESVWIADQITAKINNGADPDRIAVIYRNHKNGTLLAEILKQRNLPVYLKKSENILETDSVVSLLFVLKFITKELIQPFSAEHELVSILHGKSFNIKPLTLANLLYAYNKNRKEYQNWRSFLSTLSEADARSLNVSLTEYEKVKKSADDLENLIRLSTEVSAYALAAEATKLLGLNETLLGKKSFAFELEALVSFLNFVESNGRGNTLQEVIEKIDLMQLQGLGISREQIVFDKSGVQLLTAHSSKGLEFQHVFVMHCMSHIWENPKSMPKAFNVAKLFGSHDKEHRIEETRRLFYVAMTRAEDMLYLTYFKMDKSGKEQSRSEFIDTLASHEQSVLITPEFNAEHLTEVLGPVYTQVQLSNHNVLEPTFLDEYLANYTLSVSHLNDYLECPTRFYFQNILRVPGPKSIYLSFGIAVHFALERMVKDYNMNDFDPKRVSDYYATALQREKQVFRPKQFEDFMSLGKSILPDFIRKESDIWRTAEKIESERLIERISLKGIPLKGKLDLVEYFDGMVKVIDYKTGDAKNGKKKLAGPKPGASIEDDITIQYGGSYWRQIMFYAVLVELSDIKEHMKIGEMRFVEPTDDESYETYKVMVEPDNVNFMKELIQEVYTKIKNKEFKNGCQAEDCQWCGFMNRYYADISKN